MPQDAMVDTEAIRKSLLSKFREVTADRLEKIGLALLELEKQPDAAAPAEDVARELHTMKGEARMLALPRIAEVAHACEDLLKATREGRVTLASATDQLLHACDLVNELVDDLPKAEGPNDAAQTLCANLRAAAEAAPAARSAPTPATPPAPAASAAAAQAPAAAPASPGASPAAAPPAAPAAAAASRGARPGPEMRPAPSAAAPAAASPAAGSEGARDEKPAESGRESARSIRIGVEVLDTLGNLAGDLLVEAGRASLRSRELASLMQRVNRMGDRFLALADLVAARLPNEAPELPRLEADLHLLRDDTFRFVRKESDGLNALRGHLGRLAEHVAEARLVPLSSVFAAFPRAVRDIAKGQGKEVDLLVGNAEVGVDRGMLGDVRDAMVHLLRNSVDHGLESPEERERAGKPRKGTIKIEVSADGDMLAVQVEDDGRGIDPVRVRETAVARGVLTGAQAAALSERELVDLIFLPGFSTRQEVTDLSGRGVGMAVVKKKVDSLGGSVAVQSVPGRYTRISMRLPQSMALMRVLLVRIGGDIYGIPAADVEAVGRVRPEERIQLKGRDTVTFRGVARTLVDLSALLRLHGGPKREAPLCVFVKHGEDRAAFAVDGFVSEREVAVKPCGGDFLKGASCIAGAAALEDGSVAVLLHVPDVMFEIRKAAGRAMINRASERRLRILLVDDSPIARATESALVRALGHQVDEAVDGLDGLDKVAMQAYDAIISDIQMPRMDGIEFSRRLKMDPATSNLPIVILSSLASPEDKRRGLDAGADAYLIKGELSAETLGQALSRLVS